MFENKKRFWRYVFLGILISLAFFTLFYAHYQKSHYVVKVYNERAKVYEFSFFFHDEKREMEEQANLLQRPDLIENFWNTPIAGEEALEVAKKRALESLREFMILKIKAKENRVALTKQDVDDIEKVFMMQYQLLDESNTNQSFKERFGVEPRNFKKMLEELKRVQKFMNSLENKEEESLKKLLDEWKKDPKYEMMINEELLKEF